MGDKQGPQGGSFDLDVHVSSGQQFWGLRAARPSSAPSSQWQEYPGLYVHPLPVQVPKLLRAGVAGPGSECQEQRASARPHFPLLDTKQVSLPLRSPG